MSSTIFGALPDDAHRGVSQFGIMMSLPRRGSHSPSFACHIGRVVSGSAKKQVFWVDARRTVASMAHEHTVRDWEPVHAVVHERSAVSTMFSESVEYPVAFTVQRTGPNPATFVVKGEGSREERGYSVVIKSLRSAHDDLLFECNIGHSGVKGTKVIAGVRG